MTAKHTTKTILYLVLLFINRTIAFEQQNGEVNFRFLGTGSAFELQTGERLVSRYVKFSPKFLSTPKVVLWFKSFDTDKNFYMRIQVMLDSVDTIGFTFKVRTWMDSIVYGCGVSWLAYAN